MYWYLNVTNTSSVFAQVKAGDNSQKPNYISFVSIKKSY